MSYYDIDAILTDAQKVPCTFEISVPGLGYLEGNPGDDIKQNTKLELPLWLAEMLAVSRASSTSSSSSSSTNLTLDLPTALSTKVTNALKAEPRAVDLRSLAPHYYALAARLLDLFEDDELGELLGDTFRRRAGEIADMAYHSRGSGAGAATGAGAGAGGSNGAAAGGSAGGASNSLVGEGAEFLRGLDEDERRLFRMAHDGARSVRVWMTELKKA